MPAVDRPAPGSRPRELPRLPRIRAIPVYGCLVVLFTFTILRTHNRHR